MKVVSIHKKKNLENIDFNHRLYCKLAGYEYEKVYIDDPYMEKYLLILQKLQENEGKELIFIDSDSFFKKMEKLPELKKNLYVQKYKRFALDNFIVVRSNSETIKVFSDICYSISQQKKGNLLNQKVEITYPEKYLLEYPYVLENTDYYLNVSLFKHQEAFSMNNVLVANTAEIDFGQPTSYYFGDVLCNKKQIERKEKNDIYECVNPGKEKALVSIYTPNIANIGMIGEENLSAYCKYHDLTLHIYRDVPESLKERGIGPSWAKADLVLENWKKHKYVAWIDSDILIGKNYKINFANELTCFSDPFYPMNSGFMIFKTTKKNENLLKEVVKKFEAIDGDLNGVYVHGGDQKVFTEKIQELYPDYIFRSNFLGNSHPYNPRHLSPNDHSNMIHFMGFPNIFRYHVMDGFAQILNKEME